MIRFHMLKLLFTIHTWNQEPEASATALGMKAKLKLAKGMPSSDDTTTRVGLSIP